MSKKSLATARARAEYERLINEPASVPVSFRYDKVWYKGFGQLTLLERNETTTDKGRKAELVFTADQKLIVRLVAEYCEEFGEYEYTVWFECDGKEPTGELQDVTVLDRSFEGAEPVLRGCLGDHVNRYAPYEYNLNQISKVFESTNGRATHIVFPYFDLVHGEGGTLMALGWAGTWNAVFSGLGQETVVKMQTCSSLDCVILPGEKLRTGLVVMLPYSGRNGDDATNLWREWYMKYNLPKADAEGGLLQPFSSAFYANDTGLPNSDGSISERYFTWKPSMDKLLKEGIHTDFRWFDAGWYTDPCGRTVETDWWGTIGSWELDPVKWPGSTFRESCDAFRKEGIKTLVWFEPERVTDVENLAANYGYDPSWAVSRDGRVYTSNLADEKCLEWTLNRILSMMDRNGVDMYREDNNSDPAGAWEIRDRQSQEALGLPRTGVNENLSIQGHYRLWDGIIAYCKEHGKCPFVDSCASGGGRNDIESMRRGFPMMRSDYDRTTSSLRLSQTSTLCKWIPFHGSSTKETEYELEASKGKGSDAYVTRASFLPIYNIAEAYLHNPELDFELMRTTFGEWRSVKHLLTKDFYVLTPWHHEKDRYGFTAFAYDDPAAGESMLMVFRMEECGKDTFRAALPFAEAEAEYDITCSDTEEAWTAAGEALKDGWDVVLPEARSSRLFRIKRRQ